MDERVEGWMYCANVCISGCIDESGWMDVLCGCMDERVDVWMYCADVWMSGCMDQ